MLYRKPENLKYTSMAIYIDENVYDPSHDPETIYQYLYFLSLMLSRKQNLFNIEEEYEEFAISYASQLYLRLTNKQQFEYNSDGEPRMKRIKSILNYMKKTIRQRAIDFDTYEYFYVPSSLEDEKVTNYSFRQMVSSSTDLLERVEFGACLSDILKDAQKYLSHIPYPKGTVMYENIYLSCILSFLNSITLSPALQYRIENTTSVTPEQLERIYRKQNKKSVILFHLPEEMRGYIQALTTGMKHHIAKDLSWQGNQEISCHSNMLSLLASNINTSEGLE
jgi:hypothetical protein